jgi:hypothetical protein
MKRIPVAVVAMYAGTPWAEWEPAEIIMFERGKAYVAMADGRIEHIDLDIVLLLEAWAPWSDKERRRRELLSNLVNGAR